jgi:hypothetical protein
MLNPMLPNREMFAQDPGGYSRSAWLRWAMLAAANGATIDPSRSPTSEDLSPAFKAAQTRGQVSPITSLA